VNGDVVTELDRAVGYPAAYEALMAPDDASVLVSSFEDDRVVSFSLAGDQLVEGDVVPVALAEQMDVVTRGLSAGVVVRRRSPTSGCSRSTAPARWSTWARWHSGTAT